MILIVVCDNNDDDVGHVNDALMHPNVIIDWKESCNSFKCQQKKKIDFKPVKQDDSFSRLLFIHSFTIFVFLFFYDEIDNIFELEKL